MTERRAAAGPLMNARHALATIRVGASLKTLDDTLNEVLTHICNEEHDKAAASLNLAQSVFGKVRAEVSNETALWKIQAALEAARKALSARST